MMGITPFLQQNSPWSFSIEIGKWNHGEIAISSWQLTASDVTSKTVYYTVYPVFWSLGILGRCCLCVCAYVYSESPKSKNVISLMWFDWLMYSRDIFCKSPGALLIGWWDNGVQYRYVSFNKGVHSSKLVVTSIIVEVIIPSLCEKCLFFLKVHWWCWCHL